jgi:hypothetical protein
VIDSGGLLQVEGLLDFQVIGQLANQGWVVQVQQEIGLRRLNDTPKLAQQIGINGTIQHKSLREGVASPKIVGPHDRKRLRNEDDTTVTIPKRETSRVAAIALIIPRAKSRNPFTGRGFLNENDRYEMRASGVLEDLFCNEMRGDQGIEFAVTPQPIAPPVQRSP